MNRFSEAWSKYLEISSIHGLIYLSWRNPTRHGIFFWACLLLVSAAIFFLLIYQTTEKFLAKQTVFRIADKGIPIGDIPFPALTICSESLIFKIWKSSDYEGMTAYQLYDMLHDTDYTGSHNISYPMYSNVFPTLLKYFFDDGFNDVESIPTFAMVRGIPYSYLVTKWGLCFNFNLQPLELMLHADNVSWDFHYFLPNWFRDYRTGHIDPTFPWKVENAFNGLWIQRTQSNPQNFYHPLQGSRMIIHNTDEFPFRTGQHVQHKIYEMFVIHYTPTLTMIDDALKSWKPEQRNCFLEHEKKLKYFKIYTKINCEHECLSKEILETCGCVPFYIIRSPNDRICGVADRICYLTLEAKFDFSSCGCLNQCEELSYSLEIRHYPESLITHFILMPVVMFVYPSVRCLAFDISDLLAELGGLMGLLAGISVFSIIELIWTTLKCFRFAACKSKVAPATNQPRRSRKKFLVNKEHLLYHLGNVFVALLRKSNIHGVHYTSNKRLSKVERVFWFIVVCVMLAFSSVLVIDSLNDLRSNSVMVAIEEKIWSVEEVPFPIVDFCPDLNNHVLNGYFNCLKLSMCDGIDRKALMTMMTSIYSALQVCDGESALWIERNFVNELLWSDYKNMSVSDHFEHFLNPSWTEHNSFCMDGGLSAGAMEVNFPQGICFILNSKEKIYTQSAFTHVSGNYTTKCMHTSRIKNGMTMELKETKAVHPESLAWGEIFPSNCLSDLGVLHIEFSNPPAIYSFHNRAYSLVLTPKITTSDENLRNFHPNERNCYFEDERKLKYYNKYVRGNCMEECLADTYYELCSCVPHATVRGHNQKICKEASEACVLGVNSIIMDQTSAAFKNCDCLPDCNSIEYSLMRIESRMTSDSNTRYMEVNGTVPMQSSISIYFGSDEYNGFKRYASYNTVSLLSNIGGFLGLFLGISLFSFIEIIYFFTLRFFNNVWF